MQARAKGNQDQPAAKRCRVCGLGGSQVSAGLAVCGDCFCAQPGRALALAEATHRHTREVVGLPVVPPHTPGGVQCPLCVQQCRLGEGERGYCALRTARGGRLVHLAGTRSTGLLHWYPDPLPTNCVANWVCPGSQKRGRHNLAVFYASCTLNCLFCQNWQFREQALRSARRLSAAALAETATAATYCVCFFGGDPSSQILHALATAERLARRRVVVCWETNGTSNAKLLDHAVALPLATGGCVKFDLKAYDENLHRALTGSSNQRTLENFARAARRFVDRPQPPPLVASTLLVPGYVTPEEVGRIARFIAGLNPLIPYALLAFAPQFYMSDLPRTSLEHAEAAAAAARAAGLTQVRISNRHLLSSDS